MRFKGFLVEKVSGDAVVIKLGKMSPVTLSKKTLHEGAGRLWKEKVYMNWNNFNILLSDTYIVKNTNLLLHTLSMDGKEKGHENSLALKELDDKQQK